MMGRNRKWPAWRKVLAYGILAMLAGVSIWFIDSRAVERKGGGGGEVNGRP